MKSLRTRTCIAGIVAFGLLAPAALANICQAYSASWNQTKYCGYTARGWAKGSTVPGYGKMLESHKTITDSAVEVGAVAISSGGVALEGCHVIDETNDGYPAIAMGGTCNSGVKFAIQIGY